MSYVIHIINILDKAGADRSPNNKKILDDSVREVLGMQHANWQDVWVKVKALMQGADKEKWKSFESQVTRLVVKKTLMG
jgi:hypothetical protein